MMTVIIRPDRTGFDDGLRPRDRGNQRAASQQCEDPDGQP